MLQRCVATVLCIAIVPALAGCASPTLQPDPGTLRQPHMTDDTVVTDDGFILPYWSWLPQGRPRAVIVALHGFNDYRNAFSGPAPHFAAHGYAVYAYDQRGFGQTAERGLWPGSRELVEDALTFGRLVHARYPKTPIYLLGESMGGAVATITAARRDSPFDGVILVAPAVWSRGNMNIFMRSMLWFAVHTVPESKWTGRSLHIFASDNIPMLEDLSEDPLVIKKTRVDTIWGLVNLMDGAQEAAHRVTVPVLALYGEHDEVIPWSPVRRFLGSLREADCRLTAALYPHGYHMLLRDLEAALVVRDILAWLDHRPLRFALVWHPSGS